MNGEKAKFNIEKIEAERDILLAGRDIIIQHQITQKPIKIPIIEDTLKKGRKLEGDFFKEESRWIDFEEGFIVERKEVNEIIKKMKNEKTQLILGAPASGKSIILKNIGFKLAKDNKSVHIVELKQHSRDEIKLFFENIPKLNNENAIFIVDDAHLNFEDCEKLIEDFENEGKGNLIIGSRETEEIIKGHLKEGSEFRDLIEKKKYIRINAEDVTEEMIRTFLEKKHQKYDFSSERIKIVSDNLEKYKKDLWHLSWALKAYNPEKNSVSKDEICEKIRDSIRKIEVRKGQDDLNAENIFLPLSIFYRFEIPVERNYLEEQMGIAGNIINQLIGLHEIREKEEAHKILSLHHSSIAELFFRTYLRYLDLGRITRTKILNQKDEKDFYFPFYQYITSADRNIVDIVISLQRDFSDEKGGLTLLRKLVEQDKIQKSIETGINKEEDIEKITICISGISEANPKFLNELIEKLGSIKLESKILGESDIENIGTFIYEIFSGNPIVGIELLSDLVLKTLRTKMELELNIEKIGRFINEISYVNNLFAEEFVDIVKSKIETESDIEKIRSCVSEISYINKDFGIKLVNIVKSKLEKETEIEKVLSCIIEISRASEEVKNEILNRLNPKLRDELQMLLIQK